MCRQRLSLRLDLGGLRLSSPRDRRLREPGPRLEGGPLSPIESRAGCIGASSVCATISRKRVARLMRKAGSRGISRRRGHVVTTGWDRHQGSAQDLVRRRFAADGHNQLWVADMTYTPYLGRLPVPDDGAGRLQSPGGRLGNGEADDGRSGP